MSHVGRHRVVCFDESYGVRDGRHLIARIYRPTDVGGAPVVVGAHGGAWTSGSRMTNQALDQAVAAQGVVVVALDFRQPPAAGYPHSIADIAAGIAWTRENAHRFGGRADRIGGLGTSSGAHQLLLATLLWGDPRFPADGGALDWLALGWPVSNPLARYRWAVRTGQSTLARRHDIYWGTEPAMREGDPVEILTAGTQRSQRLPPTLIVQGTADESIPAGMTEHFAETYRGAGGEIWVELFADEPHGFITRDPSSPASRAAIDYIARFTLAQSEA